MHLGLGGVSRDFHLFHDEAGFVAGARYGVHGLIAVEDRFLEPLAGALRAARKEENYWHEIHFTDLGGSRVETSAAWRVAQRWLRIAFEHALGEVRFKAFVVDMRHDEFDHERYPDSTAAYRRFAITVGKSLIAWSLRGEGRVNLFAVTDEGNASARKLRRDGDLFSKFHVYVERECRREKQVNGKKFYPEVCFRSPLLAVPSSPSRLSPKVAAKLGCSMANLEQYSEFVQLADLLSGCVYCAVQMNPTSTGKLRLADDFASLMAERFELPWHRAVDERRRMSISMFPGPGRTPYAISLRGVKRAGIAAIKADPALLALFSARFGFHPDAVLAGQLRLFPAA